MRLSSILIGGIERVSKVLLRDFEIVQDSGDRMGTARMIVLYDPTTEPVVGSATLGSVMLGTTIVTGQLVEIFSTTAGSDSGDSLFGEPLFGEPEFGEDETITAVFRGNITNIEREVMIGHGVLDEGGILFGEPEFGGPLFGEGSSLFRRNILRLECRDWNSLLENAIVAPGTPGFTTQTDLQIITSLFGTTQPEVDLSNVTSTAVLSTFDQVENQSLRSILVRLAEQTGAFWYIDEAKSLHWFLPATRPAQFSLSEEPDGVTSFPFDRQNFRYTEEWRTPANQVTVLGEVSTAGVRVRETISEAGSITAYGTFGRTISDRSITSSAQAQARARVELLNYAYPSFNGVCSQRRAGLSVGEMLTISAPTLLHMNSAFVIRRIRWTWWSRTTTNFEIEWGSYKPELARAIRAVSDAAANGQPTSVQPTTPVDGSVGSSTIIPGSVDNVALGVGSVSNANIQALAVGSANIQNAAIQEAHIGNLEVTNIKIAADLAADKIVTGSLIVGGAFANIFVGSSGSPTAWIGTFGGNNGGWFKELYVGGTGPSDARLKSNSSGVLSISLNDADGGVSFDSSSNNRLVTIDGVGFQIFERSNHSNFSLLRQDVLVINTSTEGASLGPTTLGFSTGQVLTKRKTGWSNPTGTATRSGFATGSATLVQVAEALKALIDDSISHGLIGA